MSQVSWYSFGSYIMITSYFNKINNIAGSIVEYILGGVSKEEYASPVFKQTASITNCTVTKPCPSYQYALWRTGNCWSL